MADEKPEPVPGHEDHDHEVVAKMVVSAPLESLGKMQTIVQSFQHLKPEQLETLHDVVRAFANKQTVGVMIGVEAEAYMTLRRVVMGGVSEYAEHRL
jgi:hypothetical protein